jgi:hypothetical protein
VRFLHSLTKRRVDCISHGSWCNAVTKRLAESFSHCAAFRDTECISHQRRRDARAEPATNHCPDPRILIVAHRLTKRVAERCTEHVTERVAEHSAVPRRGYTVAERSTNRVADRIAPGCPDRCAEYIADSVAKRVADPPWRDTTAQRIAKHHAIGIPDD